MKLEEFIKDPWLLRVREDETVQMLVPKVLVVSPPMTAVVVLVTNVESCGIYLECEIIEFKVLVKYLLRKYPQWSHDCIAVVGNIINKNIQESKAKAALIWMLGEYAQDMQDAPYVLESLVENWEDEYSAEVRLHLLTSMMKCFFRRPLETQQALELH